MEAGPIVIHGAGSIGAFAGAAWQLDGADVRLLGRPWLADEIDQAGWLTLSDHAGRSARLAATDLSIASDPAILATAGLVVLTIKATALDAAIAELRAHCPQATPILALQNGLGPLERLRAALPDHKVLGGVVTHNVVHLGGGRFHKGTAGHVATEVAPALATLVRRSQGGFEPVTPGKDFAAVRWGKLIINLNNAVNAVSKLGLRAQWLDPHWRAMTVAAIREGLAVARAAGIRPGKSGEVSPQRLAMLLSLPQWLLERLPLMDKIDSKARSSMADDVAAGKPTEIDFLNGAIARLGRQYGVKTPVNDRLIASIAAVSAPRA